MSEPVGAKVSFNLRSDPAELRRLLGLAEEFARSHSLSGAERARLLIILEELFINAVSHGVDRKIPAGGIEVALACDASRLTIEFSDDGRPFDPWKSTQPYLDQTGADQRVGGWGLRIVRLLVDDARYSRDGDRNHVVLIRNITPSRSER